MVERTKYPSEVFANFGIVKVAHLYTQVLPLSGLLSSFNMQVHQERPPGPTPPDAALYSAQEHKEVTSVSPRAFVLKSRYCPTN